MASIRFDIISIGTLSRNRLWNETEAIRTPSFHDDFGEDR